MHEKLQDLLPDKFTIGFSSRFFVLEDENSLKCLNNQAFQFLEQMFTCMLRCIVNNMTNAITFQNAEMLAMQNYEHIIRIPQVYKVFSDLHIMHLYLCIFTYNLQYYVSSN